MEAAGRRRISVGSSFGKALSGSPSLVNGKIVGLTSVGAQLRATVASTDSA